MSILVTCGHEVSGCSIVHTALSLAGLPAANPFRDGAFTAEALTQKICDAHKVQDNGAGKYSQLSPGQLWQALAVDLAVANLEQESWGWADPKNIHLLDFWRDFDPRVNFVLVYAAPEYALAHLLERGTAEPKAIAEALRAWQAYNEELLRFYNSNRDRALLVNADNLSDNPSEFLAACRRRFDVDLKLINEPVLADGLPSAFAVFSASTLLDERPDARSLFEELESVADQPAKARNAQDALIARAWAQHRSLTDERDESNRQNEALRARLRQVQSKLERALAQLDEVKDTSRDNELLILQMHQLQEEMEQVLLKSQEKENSFRALGDRQTVDAEAYRQLQAQSQELQRTVAFLEAEREGTKLQVQKAADQGKDESELLRRQLNQVREELESYFLKNQALQAAIEAEREGAKRQVQNAADQGRDENELLRRQLNQVREELEYYFLKNQALQAAEGRSPSAADQKKSESTAKKPTETIIDMRHFIDGENWHHAEDDGRWAGPGPVSSLRLPGLGTGRYRLELDVVDAIDPEIVRHMQVSLNGTPIKLKRKSVARLAGPLAPLKRAYITHYRRSQLYPLLLTGDIDVDGQTAQSPLQLELTFPRTVSPATRGEADTRSLAIRLRGVKITPR